ncbi:hypothetical protein [Devosia psychrophila]|uniref:hypothetical protein n=1 Tax=Devosia psychrophila TaxID=728005 RepID=UPI00069C8BD0|nr:hypothetical protein [Devosia psychrophila]
MLHVIGNRFHTATVVTAAVVGQIGKAAAGKGVFGKHPPASLELFEGGGVEDFGFLQQRFGAPAGAIDADAGAVQGGRR